MADIRVNFTKEEREFLARIARHELASALVANGRNESEPLRSLLKKLQVPAGMTSQTSKTLGASQQSGVP